MLRRNGAGAGGEFGCRLLALRLSALMGARVIGGLSRNPQRRAQLTAFGATLALDPGGPWV